MAQGHFGLWSSVNGKVGSIPGKLKVPLLALLFSHELCSALGLVTLEEFTAFELIRGGSIPGFQIVPGPLMLPYTQLEMPVLSGAPKCDP